ncbi:hypothetical protein [Rhizohabitans arisaemae]|uniref:hypothetical protein n=1 Tax=Rhizohabitans arisaemae TaxID=2720610 RepID=UPI0024B229C6|nr:hypothetical protein [Rhizohabitans arisaemae]
MRRRLSRGVTTIAIIVLVLAVAIAAGVYLLLNRARPFVASQRCEVTTPEGSLSLDIDQAQVTATIAAVAARRKLPERAVVIAYATGIQESKLRNLPFGDRDSIGIFQQRPSQGWGKPDQLLDPVYTTERFFSALVRVKDYRKLPLHIAAQAVQRSADGNAYAQHEPDAKILAAAFTGRIPKAVNCWFAAPKATPTPHTHLDEARAELKRALGSGTSPASEQQGWLIASWSVTHAQRYNLRSVGYSGERWTALTGLDGWQADTTAGKTAVELR